MQDRTVRFEVNGVSQALCFTQRARKALQTKHGIGTLAAINEALEQPAGLETLLLAGLEGARFLADPTGKPVEASAAEAILDALPFLEVQGHVDRALVLAFRGPKVAPPPGGAEGSGGKAGS